MKTIIITFFLCLSSALMAQVTLNNTINPTVGNSVMTIDIDTNGITQGPAGANQTWGFTSIIRIDSSAVSWVASSSTPYSAQFPTSNIASTNDNMNYNFMTTSAANLLVNGTGGPGSVVPYSDPEVFMQYPFTFNSTFTDIFSATYDVGGTTTYRTGTVTVTGDAWGTINLPIGTFTNALRVKYVRSYRDSSNPGTPVVITTNLTSYVWFVPGKKQPVFEVIYTSLIFNGVPFTSAKKVNYTPNSTPIGITTISSEVPVNFKLHQNYPNPFNPSTKIKFEIASAENGRDRSVRISIYDILGREVATLVNEQLNPGTYEVDWNASDLTSGVYYYRLAAGDFTEIKKLVLLK